MSGPVGASMSVVTLRDHAQAMLDAIATDLESPQTTTEQSDKSRGLGSDRRVAATAAAEHGFGRAESGFTVIHMIAEFRALRASVVRLWTLQARLVGATELEELIRFNESIDQAIAESLARYTHEIDETRERFLAILGHDLRNPLGAIATSVSFLLDTGELTPEQTVLIRAIDGAGSRMRQLVADLLELALNRLGDTMPVTRAANDIGEILGGVAAEVQASSPGATFEVHLDGDLHGQWDAPRLAQALTNLLANAVQHGDTRSPISIAARAGGTEVVITVHNQGPAIAPEKLRDLFEGLKHGANVGRDRRHLGLGLFIVDKIVEAHGGTMDVHSAADAGTTFTLHLPQALPA